MNDTFIMQTFYSRIRWREKLTHHNQDKVTCHKNSYKEIDTNLDKQYSTIFVDWHSQGNFLTASFGPRERPKSISLSF